MLFNLKGKQLQREGWIAAKAKNPVCYKHKELPEKS